MISRDKILAWVAELERVFQENKAYLTELDSAIGDADHGINLARGFKAVREKLESQDQPIGPALKTAGMTLVQSVGGASGPLYGTFFLRLGTTCGDKEELDAKDFIEMIDAGLQGIIQRGKTQLGDKTMVDALQPAVDVMKAAAEAGEDLASVLKKGMDAAEEGMKNTTPLVAKKGRASYLGERSAGHQDPGATSSHLLLKAAYEVLGQ
jgi:phosphoenolpyruvate---glycerone phosphotransferase subunit DhaL